MSNQSAAAPAPPEKVNILLVDDQPGKLLSYEAILQELGQNLLKATSAREALEILLRYRHPVHLITKSALILRDLDLLEQLAAQNLVSVAISLTTLDNELKRIMEPRAASPAARLRCLRELHAVGVPVSVLCAPMIPMVNDAELEQLLKAARDAGAQSAGYVLLRLPLEIAELFEDWLRAHFPQRAAHVMSLVQQMRRGRDYDSTFGTRMRGEGEFATLLARRFELACKRAGFGQGRDHARLDTSQFRPPAADSPQASLF